MVTQSIVLVVAPDRAFRRSLEFALESARYVTSGYSNIGAALASRTAAEAACVVIDDHAIANWSVAIKQFLRFAGPVVLIIERFNSIPVLQRVTLVMKPFLGEPLIDAVRKAIADAA